MDFAGTPGENQDLRDIAIILSNSLSSSPSLLQRTARTVSLVNGRIPQYRRQENLVTMTAYLQQGHQLLPAFPTR